MYSLGSQVVRSQNARLAPFSQRSRTVHLGPLPEGLLLQVREFGYGLDGALRCLPGAISMRIGPRPSWSRANAKTQGGRGGDLQPRTRLPSEIRPSRKI